MADGYGYIDSTGQRVSALRDMFDGGGPGRSGDAFRDGGAISALGNALKIRPLGSTAPREDIGFRGRMGSREYFRDMFDGGGAGRSSSAGFADGPYSGLANNLMTLGLLRPIGAQRADRMAPLRPNVDMPLSDFGSQSILRQPAPSATELYGSDVTVGGPGAGDGSGGGFYRIPEQTEVTSSRIPKPYNSSGQTPASGYVPARPANYGDMRGAPMGMAGLSDAQLALANLQRGADMTAFNPVEPPPTVTSSPIQRDYSSAARFSEPLSSPRYARDMTPLGAANAFGGVAAKNPNYDPAMIMRALRLYHGRSGF